VRDAIRGYRPTLADEVERARRLLETAGVAASFDLPADGRMFQSHDRAEETIALALREATTNIARHSEAKCAAIRLCHDNASSSIVLEVVDDGRGVQRPEGSGLRGMRERVEAVDGRVSWIAGTGTRLTVTVPIVDEYSFNEATRAVSA
jgi:two-component system sensor histidine kinase DesK